MNRSNQPTKLDLCHDELDALECVLGAGAVIKEQEYSGDNLDCEKEQRHAAEVIPDGMPVNRDFLLLGQLGEGTDRQPIVDPVFS